MIVINDNLRLEPATMADAQFLFDIKNDEGARASALATKECITWTGHIAWLKKTLRDPNVELYLIMNGTRKLGSWRYDFYPEHIEFSMIIIPEARGSRLGSTVFNFCGDRIQGLTSKKIIGYIAEGNVPPMRYHIRADYTLESYDKERRCYVWTRDMAGFLRRGQRVSRTD